jgi:hypothetical protein
LRRQIDWESTLYNTLRNNADTLERHIQKKHEELQNLNIQLRSKQNQLVTIINRYKQFMQRNNRRHRRGLLFKNNHK